MCFFLPSEKANGGVNTQAAVAWGQFLPHRGHQRLREPPALALGAAAAFLGGFGGFGGEWEAWVWVQNKTTRNRTAGFSPCFHLTRATHFRYRFLTHTHRVGMVCLFHGVWLNNSAAPPARSPFQERLCISVTANPGGGYVTRRAGLLERPGIQKKIALGAWERFGARSSVRRWWGSRGSRTWRQKNQLQDCVQDFLKQLPKTRIRKHQQRRRLFLAQEREM